MTREAGSQIYIHSPEPPTSWFQFYVYMYIARENTYFTKWYLMNWCYMTSLVLIFPWFYQNQIKSLRLHTCRYNIPHNVSRLSVLKGITVCDNQFIREQFIVGQILIGRTSWLPHGFHRRLQLEQTFDSPHQDLDETDPSSLLLLLRMSLQKRSQITSHTYIEFAMHKPCNYWYELHIRKLGIKQQTDGQGSHRQYQLRRWNDINYSSPYCSARAPTQAD